MPDAALPAQTSGASRPLIKKRASLCLLRLLRKTPADAPLVVTADTFSPTMGALLEERDLGLLLCSVTLLHGVLQRSGPSEQRGRMQRLGKSRSGPSGRGKADGWGG